MAEYAAQVDPTSLLAKVMNSYVDGCIEDSKQMEHPFSVTQIGILRGRVAAVGSDLYSLLVGKQSGLEEKADPEKRLFDIDFFYAAAEAVDYKTPSRIISFMDKYNEKFLELEEGQDYTDAHIMQAYQDARKAFLDKDTKFKKKLRLQRSLGVGLLSVMESYLRNRGYFTGEDRELWAQRRYGDDAGEELKDQAKKEAGLAKLLKT